VGCLPALPDDHSQGARIKVAAQVIRALSLFWPRSKNHQSKGFHSEAGHVPSVLSTRWKAYCRRCSGSIAAWCELCLSFVRLESLYLKSHQFADQQSYAPEYEEWELGKLSALREIALTREGRYQYYYMGQGWLLSTVLKPLTDRSRVLHTLLHQDALQSQLHTNLHIR
jgi:hypothetical protein